MYSYCLLTDTKIILKNDLSEKTQRLTEEDIDHIVYRRDMEFPNVLRENRAKQKMQLKEHHTHSNVRSWVF